MPTKLKISTRKKIQLISWPLILIASLGLGHAESDMKFHNKCEIAYLIHMGDSYNTVLKLLGKPSHDDLIMKKERPTITGRRLMYIYKQEDASAFNPKTDSYLTLLFNTEGMLVDVNYHEGRVDTKSIGSDSIDK